MKRSFILFFVLFLVKNVVGQDFKFDDLVKFQVANLSETEDIAMNLGFKFMKSEINDEMNIIVYDKNDKRYSLPNKYDNDPYASLRGPIENYLRLEKNVYKGVNFGSMFMTTSQLTYKTIKQDVLKNGFKYIGTDDAQTHRYENENFKVLLKIERKNDKEAYITYLLVK